ncbi:MAG: hypothetical protein AAB295_00090 [Chloroflexota bacterium]
MARVFYVECAGEIWREVAQACAARAGWIPVLWTGAADDEQPVRTLFPEVEFFSGPDAALNLIRPSWPVSAAPQDSQALAQSEAIAVQMMDRMDAGGSFAPEERRRHYRELLRVWAGALDHFRPERVVFSIAPHIVFDYVLYALCRQRCVPTLMFERHGLPGWVFTLDAIDVPSPALQRALGRSRAGTTLPADYAQWLRGLSAGAATAMPANFRKKLALYKVDSAVAGGSMLRGAAFELKRALVLLARHGLQGPRNSYLRSSRPPHGRARWLETECARFEGLSRKRRLAAELGRLARGPVPGEPYVLMALHYQPERSTVPMGGAFGDQRLAVELLARALPQGWWLYVKEHPWQLQPFGRGEMQRDMDYYRELVRHANVRLLPLEADTSALIDGARAVATISGSVGWQAMCRGIPALVFGEAWYRACEGAFRLRSEDDTRSAFAAIASGYRAERAAVERFAAALAEVCVPGVLEPGIENVQGLDTQIAAQAMAGALIGHAAS